MIVCSVFKQKQKTSSIVSDTSINKCSQEQPQSQSRIHKRHQKEENCETLTTKPLLVSFFFSVAERRDRNIDFLFRLNMILTLL